MELLLLVYETMGSQREKEIIAAGRRFHRSGMGMLVRGALESICTSTVPVPLKEATLSGDSVLAFHEETSAIPHNPTLMER